MKKAELLPAGRDRRLHRLLHRHPPRDQHGPHVPAGQSAAAELQVGADRLPRARFVGRASAARRCGGRAARSRRRTRPRRRSARRAGSTTRPSSASSSGRAIRSANRSPIDKALDHVFGVVLLNDWSARDIQAWEYQPLGPFLAKSFATTISPWIVTLEALAPFRCAAFPRARRRSAPLPYLVRRDDQRDGRLRRSSWRCICAAPKMQIARRASRAATSATPTGRWRSSSRTTRRTAATCGPGDLLGSGTISGAPPDSLGSLMELTQGGKAPLALPGGETRTFLEDGDEVIQRGCCSARGLRRIGFGEAPALASIR